MARATGGSLSLGSAAGSWRGSLSLDYRREAQRSLVRDRHDGPLRILKSLYPEGDAVCHTVLVHPPAGMVGGDDLSIDVSLAAGAHALVTTPGATRFYRSLGPTARQSAQLRVAAGARVEWLPLESIAYSGCRAENHLRCDLADGAEMIGFDVVALGLPTAEQPFAAGEYGQCIELPGHWLERGRIAAADTRALCSPLLWAGRSVLATAWFGAGSALSTARRDALLDAARERIAAHPLAATAGATAPCREVVVVRVLADRVEPAMGLLREVWAAWRPLAWQLPACPPRVWQT